MRKEFIIDGRRFSTMRGFYDEVERVFTCGLHWRIGQNLPLMMYFEEDLDNIHMENQYT